MTWNSLFYVCLNYFSFYLLLLPLSAIFLERPSWVMFFWVFDHWVVFQHVDYKASHLPGGCCKKEGTLICLLWCWWLKAFADLERVCECVCVCVCVWVCMCVCACLCVYVCVHSDMMKDSVTALGCDQLQVCCSYAPRWFMSKVYQHTSSGW